MTITLYVFWFKRQHMETDFVITFQVNNTPIYRSKCSFLVHGELIDTGSYPSIVDDKYWIPSVNCVFQNVAFLWSLLYFKLTIDVADECKV